MVREIDKRRCKYLGIGEIDKIKQMDITEKFASECKR